jgi:hypothetical protein
MSESKHRVRSVAKNFAALIGLLATVSALAAVQAPPLLLAMAAVAWLLLFFFLQRKHAGYTPASLWDRGMTLVLVLAGYGVGRLLPVEGLNYFPQGLGLALLFFISAGMVELPVLERVLPRASAVARLDRHRFPFFSLGVALAVVLGSS